MRTFLSPGDPLDMEIEDGVPIRSLTTAAACTSAIIRMQREIADIESQLARYGDGRRTESWRASARGAIKWRYSKIKVVRKHCWNLAGPDGQKDSVLLQVIAHELGEHEFDRLRSIASQRYPVLFQQQPQSAGHD